jgi:hypothetical protein
MEEDRAVSAEGGVKREAGELFITHDKLTPRAHQRARLASPPSPARPPGL